MAQTSQSTGYEAYVINPDGTTTETTVSYADAPSSSASAPRGFAVGTPFPGFAYVRTEGAGGTRQYAGPAVNAAPAPKLHIGRRLAGLVIAAVGVPLLILPGPGLLLIGIGLAMAIAP